MLSGGNNSFERLQKDTANDFMMTKGLRVVIVNMIYKTTFCRVEAEDDRFIVRVFCIIMIVF